LNFEKVLFLFFFKHEPREIRLKIKLFAYTLNDRILLGDEQREQTPLGQPGDDVEGGQDQVADLGPVQLLGDHYAAAAGRGRRLFEDDRKKIRN
jgi:hypothetical protein